MSVLAEVQGWVRLLSAGILAYAAVLGLWPAWITPGPYFLFLMLLLPLFGLLGLVAVATWIRLLWDWHKQRAAKRAWLAPLLLLVAMALALPTLWAAQYVQGLVLFSAVQDWTRTHVAQLSREDTDGPLGMNVTVDPGPPVRIAFMTFPGFLDNWSGIVFDPTGAVMQADGWDATGKFRAPDAITKLFGGDIVSCSHILGDYYRCEFT